MVQIQKIDFKDNEAIKNVIKTVFIEHGIDRPGTAFFDPCLNDMFSFYTSEKSTYFIVKLNGILIGGAGVYPTQGLPEDTCELVKMYLLNEHRGVGIGRMLIEKCIESAIELGYKNLYLETTPELNSAIKMYEKFGFLPKENRMGNSGIIPVAFLC